MTTNAEPPSDDLYDSVRHAYARLVYSHKAQEKQADRIASGALFLKRAELVLVAATAGSTLPQYLHFLSPYLAFATLLATLYQYRFDPDAVVRAHRSAAHQMWILREEYCALLSDIHDGSLSATAAKTRRDELKEKLAAVYESAPDTDRRAYKAAQRALKVEDEFSFSEAEINQFLPARLRKYT